MTITRSLFVLSLIAGTSLIAVDQVPQTNRCACGLKHRPRPKQKRTTRSTDAIIGQLRCPCSHRPRQTAKPKHKLTRVEAATVQQLRCACSAKHHQKQRPSKPARAK